LELLVPFHELFVVQQVKVLKYFSGELKRVRAACGNEVAIPDDRPVSAIAGHEQGAVGYCRDTNMQMQDMADQSG
jgi:hypothetical protein